MAREFYLLVDSCLCCCYAVSMWVEKFDKKEQFKGILVREDKPSEEMLKQRNEFHKKYAYQKELTEGMCRELVQLYGSFDETEKAMISLFGVPKYSITPDYRTERIIDPFRFNSIWELKGYTYMIGYNLYVEMAQHIILSLETTPVGIVGDPNLRGPNFRTKDLTKEQKRRAEEGYLSMKQSVSCWDVRKPGFSISTNAK